jgi:hypothetical protein
MHNFPSHILGTHLTSGPSIITAFFFLPHLAGTLSQWDSLVYSIGGSSLGVSTVNSIRSLNNLLSFCLDLLDAGTEVVHTHNSQEIKSVKVESDIDSYKK